MIQSWNLPEDLTPLSLHNLTRKFVLKIIGWSLTQIAP